MINYYRPQSASCQQRFIAVWHLQSNFIEWCDIIVDAGWCRSILWTRRGAGRWRNVRTVWVTSSANCQSSVNSSAIQTSSDIIALSSPVISIVIDWNTPTHTWVCTSEWAADTCNQSVCEAGHCVPVGRCALHWTATVKHVGGLCLSRCDVLRGR